MIFHDFFGSYLYRFLNNKIKKILYNIDPKIEIIRTYKKAFGKTPNLKEPSDLIEKIYYMELNHNLSLWTKCSDKYRMRDYIEQKGLSQYLPQLLAVWNSPDEIDFTDLQDPFVIKLNNGCGDCLVVKDKSLINEEQIRRYFKKQLKIHIGYDNSQTHYLNIKPCIIAEELLVQDEMFDKVSPHSLVDFKFWAFRGNVESCFVAYERNGHYLNMDLKNLNWQSMPQYMKPNYMLKYNSSVSIPKPKCFDEMIHIASVLSEEFPEVRIDLYSCNGKPVIGEMTFSSGYGYFTHDYYKYLGEKVIL